METITVYTDRPETPEIVALQRLADVIGRDRVIADEEDVRNGSGRLVGIRYTLTAEAADSLRQESEAVELS